MKRFFSSLTLSALLFSLAPAMALAGGCYVDPVYQYSGTGTIKSGVFMRNEACVDSTSILMTLSARSSVQVIGYTDGWFYVEFNGARGWIGQQFLDTAAQRTGLNYSSYEEYMDAYPSRGPTAGIPTPAPTGETPYQGDVLGRSLIKLVCPSVANVDHPCKAVYYIGIDGKRHAFPNSRVYATWYLDFSNVKAVSAERLGLYALGANVTYRPGARMVKFTTDPKVYVVGRGGILRWIKTEELARSMYGSDWNKKIDDIADVFYTNYTFGTEVASQTDYSPVTEMTEAPTFD